VSEHIATIAWTRAPDADFVRQRYSRGHRWEFDGGVEVPASASPHVVPPPYSVAAAVDPEEAFVASLASCHMLWFLSLAAKAGHVVEEYRDAATGRMGRNAAGKTAMLEVTLHPEVTFAGRSPGAAAVEALHHRAHEECYLASSVTTVIRCEGTHRP
jgi:organic hydroperoxide reductase OsmC/OhrA